MSAFRRRILVTAATGRQGWAATHALLERDWPVRALVRDPTSPAAAALAAAGAEDLGRRDFDDPVHLRSRLRASTACSSTNPDSCPPS